MICPSCGSQRVQGQKFCRSCGANLQVTTQRLEEPAGLSNSQDSTAIEPTSTARRANNWMLWGFVMLFIGAAIGVVGKKLLHQEIVTVAGILMSLLGMFLTVFPYVVPARAAKRSAQRPSQGAESATPSALTPGNTEYLPSVTERTTDLLEPSAAARRSRGEDRQ
jgi:hypothetical protein